MRLFRGPVTSWSGKLEAGPALFPVFPVQRAFFLAFRSPPQADYCLIKSYPAFFLNVFFPPHFIVLLNTFARDSWVFLSVLFLLQTI